MIEHWEVLSLLILCCLGWLALSVNWASAQVEQVSIVLSVALITILSSGAYARGKQGPAHIWALLFWFRVSCATYYGFGGIVPFIVNDSTDRFLRSVFDYTAFEVLRVNIICLFGITMTMLGAYISEKILPSPKPLPTKRYPAPFSMTQMAVILLIGGGLVRYGLQMRVSFQLTEVTIPGGILFLGNAYLAGLFLVLVIGLRRGGSHLALATTLFAIDLAVFGLLSFSKLELLRTLVFGFLAIIFVRFSAIRLAVAFIALVAAFTFSQPFVHYGRSQVDFATGGTGAATLEQRLDITSAYVSGDKDQSNLWGDELQPFLRFTYVNVGAFVAHQYDRGWPGDSLRHALIAVIPRAVWPEKPITGHLGAELYELIRRHDGASVAAGYFSEVYWNFGWWGLPSIFLPVGFLFALISRYALDAIRSRNWFYFPAVLVGVQMGIRTDGHFTLDVTGAAAIFVVLAVVLGALNNLMSPRGHMSALSRNLIYSTGRL